MIEKQFVLTPEGAHDMEHRFRIVRRSLDARQRQIKVNLTVLCDDEGRPVPFDAPVPLYAPPVFRDVTRAERSVRIIGAGPAGLFAALTLLEQGIKPIIYERGKEVSERKKDIALLNRNEGLNPESNYCFGEGGAGTFSDGKLFSRSKKRGNMQHVMELFHHFGAPDSVLYEAHAHIGSDKLPTIIRNMRECILAHGGEIHFNTRMDHIRDVARPCILAIGHSAHDTYRMLAAEGVALEPKGFALGVRCEFPQALINRIMYHLGPRGKNGSPNMRVPLSAEENRLVTLLGNASYSLVTQVEGRGVYSFCMCPGGHIVPAGSAADGCVVNGMSASHRNSPYANSGIVVEVRPEDVPDGESPEGATPAQRTHAALQALAYQELVEMEARRQAGPEAQCPAQRLRDFVDGKASVDLPPTSYIPGVIPSRLDQWLPKAVGKRLQQGFRDFDHKYPGLLTNDAVIHGVESRSSSPVRIPRDPETMEALGTPGLYPVGEGAGYAGGITSSALDGINAALRIAQTDI